MPSVIRTAIVRYLQQDSWPFSDDVVSPGIRAYGGECLIYRMRGHDDRGEMCIKRYHFAGLESAKAQLESKVSKHKLYEQYFGRLVTPTSYILAANEFRTGGSVVIGVQPLVEGSDMFEVGLANANPSDLSLLMVGIHAMQEQRGLVPDLGRGNVLVDAKNGRINIVDIGHLYSTSDYKSIPGSTRNSLAIIEEWPIPTAV